MRQLRAISVLALPLLLLLSCETSVEPKGPFTEHPVLYGIATSSSLGNIVQQIVVTRTYDLEGIQVPDSTIDRGISGAVVTLSTSGNDIALQEDTVIFRYANGDSLTRLMYRSSSFRFGPQQLLSVRAQLPDGRTLTAETTSPPFFYFEPSYRFPRGITTKARDRTGDTWTLRWDNSPSHMFWPRLTISYQHTINDSTRRSGSIEVPMDFIRHDGAIRPVYPTQTWQPSCSFAFSAIDSAMARISEGDPLKNRYRIISANFSVTTYDPHLSRYYTSAHGSADEYSIRTDPAFYSNIQGGIGIFGSQTVSSFEYMLDPLYVMSFGYLGSG